MHSVISWILELTGLAAVVVGLWMVFPPAALVVGGVFLVAAGYVAAGYVADEHPQPTRKGDGS